MTYLVIWTKRQNPISSHLTHSLQTPFTQTTNMRPRTIHMSFTGQDEDIVLHNEIMRQSTLSFAPASVIIRENLKRVLKENGSLSLSN